MRLIQLRERDLDTRTLLSLSTEILSLVRAYDDAILIINDRIDVAMAIEADGVHLRSDSIPLREARRILGPHCLIGVSTHSSEEVRQADGDGADFVVLGPIYATPSKGSFGPPIGLQPLQEACQACHAPLYAIGGMTADRTTEVLAAGAYGVAVISSILEADSVRIATRQFLDVLK